MCPFAIKIHQIAESFFALAQSRKKKERRAALFE
jgi:hypothetical protein